MLIRAWRYAARMPLPAALTRPVSLCVLLLVLSGCASLGGGLQPPEVSLVDLAPLPSEGFEQRFEITIRIVNPNAVALVGDGIDLRLEVNGQRFGRAISGERFEVPRLGEELVTLVATTNLLDVFRQMMALPAAGGRLDYALEGRLLRADSLAWLRFSREGSLLPQAPPRR